MTELPASAATAAQAAPRDAAERRQVTVMFSDLYRKAFIPTSPLNISSFKYGKICRVTERGG